ncbi:hypothetical protein [Methylobacterium fujisawaense]
MVVPNPILFLDCGLERLGKRSTTVIQPLRDLDTDRCYNLAMHFHTVMVRLKNGAPELSEDPTPVLPPALIRSEQLWRDRGRRQTWPKDHWAFVRAAIEPVLYAKIEPESEHYANGLLNPKGAIQARSIELSSVSFENGPLPTISGYAQFQLTFDRAFTDSGELYDWMDATDWMDWSLCFGFRLEDGSEWDVTYDHAGIDFELIVP